METLRRTCELATSKQVAIGLIFETFLTLGIQQKLGRYKSTSLFSPSIGNGCRSRQAYAGRSYV